MLGCQIPLRSVPVQYKLPVTQCSEITVPLLDVDKLIESDKGNSLFRGKVLQSTVLIPKEKDLTVELSIVQILIHSRPQSYAGFFFNVVTCPKGYSQQKPKVKNLEERSRDVSGLT